MRADTSSTANVAPTHAADPTPPTSGGRRRRRSVVRVIAGCLAAGTTTALLLTLVVFPGATESTITGSLLLAAGLSWAMIAALTVRLTEHPQRWARVPAATMTAAGLGLISFAPDGTTLTGLAWVWPPMMLALAVWMTVRMRRVLPRGGRWLLLPVIAALAVTALGATYEDLAVVRDQQTYPAPGKTFDVGGYRLHLNCQGTGSPTVVLNNGLGEVSASWTRITSQIAPTARVCAYDRAGQGWSQDSRHPQDGLQAAHDLHTLLARANESGPFVFVGHSIGGTYAMVYAARYPEQVAGLVLLDSSSPQQFTAIPSFAGQYAIMQRAVGLLPTLARLGLVRIAPSDTILPAPAAEQVHALTTSARGERNGRDEQSILPQLFTQAQALSTLDAKPLAVVTASETLTTDGWAAAQDRLAALSSNSVHWTADSTHAGLLEDQHDAADSVRAINDVIAAVRTGLPADAG